MNPRAHARGVLWYGVNRVLELAEVKKGDVAYDLGSGDGRIVITAAKKYGARAVEFEIDHNLVRMSRASVKREGVGHLVEIREQDVMTADFSPASVVTIYLLPGSHMLLRPVLWRQLKPGAEWVPTMTIWKTGHRKMS